ncbi:MAG: hypothetical protein ABEJ05_06745 [Haloglomus sp.]
MDVDRLDRALAAAFDAGAGERRAVARMACDLAATGRYRQVADHDLTPEVVVSNLEDAPDDELASKWNWWLGALEIAFGRDLGSGGFAEFQVRGYERGETDDEGDADGHGGGDADGDSPV